MSWILIELAHWNNCPWVDMLPHSHILSWFWANQSLLLLLNACMWRSNKYQFYSLWFDPQSTVLEASTLTITPPMWLLEDMKQHVWDCVSLSSDFISCWFVPFTFKHISRDRAGLRQCRHLRFLISFGDKIRPLAIYLATTFYLTKITSYCCQSTAQVRNIVC